MKLIYDEAHRCFRCFIDDFEVEVYLTGSICDVSISTTYPMGGDLFNDFGISCSDSYFTIINKLKYVYKRGFGL